jgi:hypothetical protein
MAEITPGTQFIGMAPGLDLKERRSASNNSKTEVYTLEDIQETVLDLSTPPSDGDVLTYDAGASTPVWSAPSGGGSEYTETIVNISSADILSFNTQDTDTFIDTGLTVNLPNTLYVDRFEVSFTAATTEYSLPSGVSSAILIFKPNFTILSLALMDVKTPFNASFVVNPQLQIINNLIIESSQIASLGGKIGLIYLDENGEEVAISDLLTDGNASAKIKIYHKTITFGE